MLILSMDKRHIDKIKERIEKGTLRSLSHFPNNIDFYSNDYLGLAKEQYSAVISGSTGSRLISGTTNKMLEAEQEIARFFGAESSLMFNSGYDANLGFFSCVPHRNDTVIYDEFIHASVRDGLRLGFANSFSFKHNDVDDLEDKINKSIGTIYIVIESVYSMDGDRAPLIDILDLAEHFGAFVILDEAHACGVFGEQGKGLGIEFVDHPSLLARLVTFGKAYGSHGAAWIGSKDLITYLTNFARSFIYTTALPEVVFVHNAAVITSEILEERRAQLKKNIEIFRELFKHSHLLSESDAPIQILRFDSIDELIQCSQKLLDAGFNVKPIFSPTVPEGKERLRICIHSFNTEKEITRLREFIK